MKRTIYNCWQCRHHNSKNLYGIDYCEVHDTRCSFAHDDCDNFEPTTDDDGTDRQSEPPCRLTLIGWYLLGIALVVLLGLLLTGCTTTKYVPVPEYHTDTLRQVTVRHDSVMVRDSIHVSEKGDTVRIERWHTQWRDRWLRDTIYQGKRDIIPYPVEVIKEVPRELTWWQQARMHAGDVAIGIAVIAGVLWVFCRHIRSRSSC